MKVIELLNKIANGEEVPKKIKYKGSIYTYLEQEGNKIYQYEDYNAVLDIQCFEKLNDEVEIIEEEMCHKCHKYLAEHNQTYCEFCLGISKLEEKKIPEKLIPTSLKGIDNLDEKIEIAHIDTISVIEIVNQLIDYLQSKGE